MPSNPLAALPASTTLGMTLLGLSATLFAVDVAGTVVLNDDAHGAIATAVTQPAMKPSGPRLPQMPPEKPPAVSRATIAAAPVRTISVPRPNTSVAMQHVEDHRTNVMRVTAKSTSRMPALPVPVRPALPPAPTVIDAHRPSISTVDARDASLRGMPAVVRMPVPALVRPNGEQGVRVIPARLALAPIARLEPRPQSAAFVRKPIATSRDVRHFVMQALQRSDSHLCVISATTYSGDADHVVADIVYRDRGGRWWAKAVVARRGTALKLIGVKRHALPYQAVATTVGEP